MIFTGDFLGSEKENSRKSSHINYFYLNFYPEIKHTHCHEYSNNNET